MPDVENDSEMLGESYVFYCFPQISFLLGMVDDSVRSLMFMVYAVVMEWCMKWAGDILYHHYNLRAAELKGPMDH